MICGFLNDPCMWVVYLLVGKQHHMPNNVTCFWLNHRLIKADVDILINRSLLQAQ
uniref:Uncharacterized protein n=1 Tax=Rhizophora mucronata TaxID=61149 RepID=A0A2P2QDN8_RHIMU